MAPSIIVSEHQANLFKQLALVQQIIDGNCFEIGFQEFQVAKHFESFDRLSLYATSRFLHKTDPFEIKRRDAYVPASLIPSSAFLELF